jgi:hypothetical protein
MTTLRSLLLILLVSAVPLVSLAAEHIAQSAAPSALVPGASNPNPPLTPGASNPTPFHRAKAASFRA